VRYQLIPETATWDGMNALAGLMENLARERVFDELCKLLPLISARELISFAPILCWVLPELAPMLDFPQHSKHHIYDLMEHTAKVVEAVPPQLHLRWAALLHDIGKPGTCVIDDQGEGHYHGHAKESALLADTALLRLKAPTALRKQVTDLIARHMTPLEPDKRLLRRRLGKYGIQETQDLLELQKADYFATGTKSFPGPFPEISRLIDEILNEEACLSIQDLSVDGKDLLELGFVPGPKLGACLGSLLRLVQEDAIPNEKAALLQKAKELLEQ
jgi:tRNA nucleotidyltransferase (CCA-adding enzyme)